MLDHSAFHHADGEVMGGPWMLRHRPVDGLDPEAVAAVALAALRRVDAQMSTYRADSCLMALNVAPTGSFVPVPDEVLTVMATADRWARLSDGAINIALGRLVNDWGFGPAAVPDTAPDQSDTAAEAARAALGAYALRQTPPAVFKHEDVRFDLCALAKGFAVDQAADAVRRLGVTDFLVEAAGEIVAQGDGPDGQGWTIGLELPVPSSERLIYDDLRLEGAIATTGGYRNRREIDGAVFSHTIDPRSGAPLETDLLSVTVLHDSCMEADALATVLYVLGPDEGPRFAGRHNVAALFLIRKAGGLKEIRSEAFVGRL